MTKDEFINLAKKYNLTSRDLQNSGYAPEYILDAGFSFEIVHKSIMALVVTQNGLECIIYNGSGKYYSNKIQAEPLLKAEIINRKKKIIQNKLNNIKKDFK